MSADLHVVAFNVPWPPNYGGVIDVYYRLQALQRIGVRIALHVFDYGRGPARELHEVCSEVHYYARRTPLLGLLGGEPYIVSSRADVRLLDRLLRDDRPILFDGLHTCSYLADEQLARRRKVVRMHNVEWKYYKALADIERRPWKELYFTIESRRLKRFERVLDHAAWVACISPADTTWYRERLGSKAVHLPAFHPHTQVDMLLGRGDFALYHGNLSVGENVQAASYLIRQVFDGLGIPLVVAGMDPDYKLVELAGATEGVELVANPDEAMLDRLVRDAHVHVMPTFQATGIKLKLLRVLFTGRHVVANTEMVADTGLEPYVLVADGADAFREAVRTSFEKPFTAQKVEQRRALESEWSNRKGAETLTRLLFAPRPR